MAIFKVVISDPKSRKSFQIEVDQSKATGLVGKKIGDEFNGDLVDLAGYALQITGGTDKDGFPMYPGLKGSGRKKMLLAAPPGFHPRLKGQRRRKTVRGNTISDSIMQINAKIIKMGEKPLEQLIPKKEKKEKKEEQVQKEEKPKETPKEAPKETPKEAPKKEKPEEKPAEEKKADKESLKEKPVEKPKEEIKEDEKKEVKEEKVATEKKEKAVEPKTEKTGGGESKDKN